MPSWMKFALVVLVAGSASGFAHAENPVDFFQRMLAPTIEELKGGPPAKFAKPAVEPQQPGFVKPADTPLLAVPLPHLRPEDDPLNALAPDPTMGFLPDAARETVVIPTEDMPMPPPRLRPAQDAQDAFGAPRLASVPANPLPKLIRPPPAARSTCGVSLAMLGVTAAPLDEIEEGACGMTAPVEIASLEGGEIDITGKAVVNCQVAETLAAWIDETVDPLAAKMLGGKITNLRVAAGYACRGRNNIASAKLSEHGKGNAIDIAAFEIEGRGWVTVGKTTDDREQAFLAGVRKSACGPFKTVLGPGSDPYHSDHFHLDLAQRRTTGPSRGLYCH